MKEIAQELDWWLRFAGCEHLGLIAVAMGADDKLIVYWDKTRGGADGLPSKFHGKPLEVKRIGQPIPA